MFFNGLWFRADVFQDPFFANTQRWLPYFKTLTMRQFLDYMQDLTEIITKRQFLLGLTDIPDISHTSGVHIKTTEDELIVFWDNSNTMDEQMNGRQEFQFNIRKKDILTIKSFPKQDIQEGDNSWNTDHYPELVITHQDPYGVVEFFTTKLQSSESYWIKALAKYLSQQFNLNIDQN